jgi:hypothetical protein
MANDTTHMDWYQPYGLIIYGKLVKQCHQPSIWTDGLYQKNWKNLGMVDPSAKYWHYISLMHQTKRFSSPLWAGIIHHKSFIIWDILCLYIPDSVRFSVTCRDRFPINSQSWPIWKPWKPCRKEGFHDCQPWTSWKIRMMWIFTSFPTRKPIQTARHCSRHPAAHLWSLSGSDGPEIQVRMVYVYIPPSKKLWFFWMVNMTASFTHILNNGKTMI